MQSGSGYGAVNILTPSEALSDASRAAQQATQSQLATATLPDEIAMSGNKRQMSDLALVDSKTSSLARNTVTQDGLIANAAALATTPEEWDQAMQDLADKGVAKARQFIGRFSTGLKGRVANAYAASTAPSALAAMQSDNPTGVGGAESGLASVAGGAGAGVQSGVDATAFDRQFASATPEQLQTAYQHLEKIKQAIQAVAASPTPAAEWDRQAVALGMQEQVGKYSPQALQDLTQNTMPVDNYLRGRLVRDQAGVPAPKIPAKLENVGGTLYGVNESDPSNPTAAALTPQGKSIFVGTDKDGKAVYFDPVTGKEMLGNTTMATARYSGGGRGGGNSVFAQKMSAYLAVHPNDQQGAMDFASGRSGKNMSAQQIQTFAQAQAARDLQAATLAGEAIPDAGNYLATRAAEIASNVAAAGPTPGAPTPPPPGGLPASALAYLKGGKPVTFKNGQTWVMKNGHPVQIK